MQKTVYKDDSETGEVISVNGQGKNVYFETSVYNLTILVHQFLAEGKKCDILFIYTIHLWIDLFCANKEIPKRTNAVHSIST